MRVYSMGDRGWRSRLIDLVDLWAAGVLTSDAVVWVNARLDEPLVWALDGAWSGPIWVHRASGAGFARITTGRIRWARTHDASRLAPSLDLPLSGLPVPASRLTVAVAHPDPAATVAVIADTRRGQLDGTGRWSKAGVTIVDLTAARRAHATAPPAPGGGLSPVAAAAALAGGTALLTAGLTSREAAVVAEQAEALAFDLDAEVLSTVSGTLDGLDTWTAQVGAAGLTAAMNTHHDDTTI